MSEGLAAARYPERLDDVFRGELRVREHDVAPARLVRIRGVHAHGPRMQFLGILQRPEVVDHRCAHPGALRRIHPVRELENVEATDEPLGRRPSEPAPGPARRVRERDGEKPLFRRHAVQRALEQRAAADADRTERDQIALARRGLGDPAQRAEDVVADARPRMREGRHVVGDPHGAV